MPTEQFVQVESLALISLTLHAPVNHQWSMSTSTLLGVTLLTHMIMPCVTASMLCLKASHLWFSFHAFYGIFLHFTPLCNGDIKLK